MGQVEGVGSLLTLQIIRVVDREWRLPHGSIANLHKLGWRLFRRNSFRGNSFHRIFFMEIHFTETNFSTHFTEILFMEILFHGNSISWKVYFRETLFSWNFTSACTQSSCFLVLIKFCFGGPFFGKKTWIFPLFLWIWPKMAEGFEAKGRLVESTRGGWILVDEESYQYNKEKDYGKNTYWCCKKAVC